MGEKFKKWVEESTESRYVPLGSICDLCGRKLGFFHTGFWSCNTRPLKDGILCSKCTLKIETLANEMHQWMSEEMFMQWWHYEKYNWPSMSIEQVRTLIALKERNNTVRLKDYGKDAKALFRVQESFWIEPRPLDVGVFRLEKLKNKIVVYGRVDQGEFHKDDSVRIDHDGQIIETRILEAYDYDPDVPENNFDICLRSHMGKQRLSEDQAGWLILDYTGSVYPGDRIIG